MRSVSKAFIFLLLIMFLGGVLSPVYAAGSFPKGDEVEFSYKNPIKSSGADPWVYYHDGYYYYTDTTAANITIRKSRSLVGIENTNPKVVWTPPILRTFGHPSCIL